MAKMPLCHFSVALFLILAMGAPAAGLTIYRLGGENLPPPPEVERGEADLRQFSWADIEASRLGSGESLIIGSDAISPLFFTAEENIAPTVWERGGYLQTQGFQAWVEADDIQPINDLDRETAYVGLQGADCRREIRTGCGSNVGEYQTVGKTFLFNLGGLFAVNKIRFFTRTENQDNYIEAFQVWTNTATNTELGISFEDLCSTSGAGHLGNCVGFVNRAHSDLFFRKDLLFQAERKVRENTKPTVDVELSGEYIRRLALFVPSQNRDWEIAEFEIFAPGYVPTASYTSNILDLGEEMVLGWVRWSGHKDAAAKVAIRSQSGSDANPNIYWRKTFRGDEQVNYNDRGGPLTLGAYQRLELSEQGKITRDAENWDLWSIPYDFADSLGVPLAAAKPRQFVQFQVDFESDAAAGSELRYVEFAASPPAATELVGEIEPWQVETTELTRFTYAIRPTIGLDSPGFDRLEISVDGGRLVDVDVVRIGGEEVAFTELEVGDDRLVVAMPKVDFNRTEELIEVVFNGEIFRFGVTFAGRVSNSEMPQDIRQPIQPGNATALLDGNTLSVQSLSLGVQLIDSLSLSLGVFTPNGDGVNDGLDIAYDLLKLTAPSPVVVEVRDLAGRRVREVYNGFDTAGRHVRRWDGMDGSGQKVSPGLYICRVEAAAEEGRKTKFGVVSVVY